MQLHTVDGLRDTEQGRGRDAAIADRYAGLEGLAAREAGLSIVARQATAPLNNFALKPRTP
jgi:hypothetical protein